MKGESDEVGKKEGLMHCQHCGKALTAEASYCSACGTAIKTEIQGDVVEASADVPLEAEKLKTRHLILGLVGAVLAVFAFYKIGVQQSWWGGSESGGDLEMGETAPEQRGHASSRGNAAQASAPVKVSAAPVVFGDLVQSVHVQGRAYVYESVYLVNEVGGVLRAVHVMDGDRVEAGQLLAEIDDREYRLDCEEAQAAYLAAQADYVAFNASNWDTFGDEVAPSTHLDTLDDKFEKGLVSRETYQQEKFSAELKEIREGKRRDEVIVARTLEQARIRLEKAQLKLEKCRILAPFPGVLYELSVAPGQLLNPSTQLARLVNVDLIMVKAKVLESEIGQIMEGRSASIQFAAMPDRVFEGEVKVISPFVNEQDKTVEVLIKLKQASPDLRPGMFAEVELAGRQFRDRLLVPKTAILPRDDRKVVFKVGQDQRAKWIYVETGVENDEFVEITKGDLKDGDWILVDSHFTMGHDTLVDVVNKD